MQIRIQIFISKILGSIKYTRPDIIKENNTGTMSANSNSIILFFAKT